MLVNELGGNGISVRSEMNVGSSFRFEIPDENFIENLETDVPKENSYVNVPSLITRKAL